MPTINTKGKISFLPEDIEFVKNNWQTMTNPELANSLGLKLTRFRTLFYELGLKRMELEYWNAEQVQYLRANYQKIGDVEIAEYFEKQCPKKKPWTKKHIEKKRRYLKLHRSENELVNVRTRNSKQGRWNTVNQRWKTTGVTEVGTIKQWKNPYNNRLFYVIKTEKGFVHYYRWLWMQSFGKLKSNKLVVPKREALKNKLLTIDQLEVIERSEHACRNTTIRMQFPSEIRELTTLINKIGKQIKNQEKC